MNIYNFSFFKNKKNLVLKKPNRRRPPHMPIRRPPPVSRKNLGGPYIRISTVIIIYQCLRIITLHTFLSKNELPSKMGKFKSPQKKFCVKTKNEKKKISLSPQVVTFTDSGMIMIDASYFIFVLIRSSAFFSHKIKKSTQNQKQKNFLLPVMGKNYRCIHFQKCRSQSSEEIFSSYFCIGYLL